MSNLLSRGRSMLVRNLKTAAGVSITYTRGTSSLTLTAWPGNTLFKVSDDSGLRVFWGERDYLIAAADLTLGEPAENDRIAETIDGTAMVFEVLPPAPNEPAWRWSDPSRKIYRVHVKRVS